MKRLSIDEGTFKRGATITSRHLHAIGACGSQIKKFRREWPDGMKLLKKNLMRASEIGLDVPWLVNELRGVKLIRISNTAWLTMRRALDAWDEAGRGQRRITLKAYYRAGAEALWRAIRDG